MRSASSSPKVFSASPHSVQTVSSGTVQATISSGSSGSGFRRPCGFARRFRFGSGSLAEGPFGSPQGQLRSAGLEALSGRAQDLLLQLGDFALKPRDRRFDRSQLGGATLQRCRVFGQLHIALGQLRSKGGNLLVLVHTWLVVRERGLV